MGQLKASDDTSTLSGQDEVDKTISWTIAVSNDQ
jgi:hypothetical protein